MRRIVPTLLGLAFLASSPTHGREPAKRPPSPVVVWCSDGSLVRLEIFQSELTLKTTTGVVKVPIQDIQQIDLATRIPKAIQARIDACIKDLTHDDFQKREAASKTLLGYEEKAIPALNQALKSKVLEVARRARAILAKLSRTMSKDRMKYREQDVIKTSKTKLVGTLMMDSIKVRSTLFGEHTLALSSLIRIRPGVVMAKIEPRKVLPNPGYLTSYNTQIGKKFYFRVTGKLGGAVWGTDIYTSDSRLATSAVHCGALKVGETGILEVTMLASPPRYTGSSRNGVSTGNWGSYTAAYSIKKVE